jgi:peptidoglycan-associated lipoprotein
MRWVHLLLILSLVCSGGLACKKKKKAIKEPVATPTETPIKENKPTNTNTNNTTNTPPKIPDNTPKEDKLGSFGPIYFSYDSPDLSVEAKATLDRIAEYLEAHPNITIIISGHADERGTEEYNLSLGDDRAKTAQTYLLRWKIDSSRIKAISYGEEKPVIQGEDEGSWSQNRRDEFELSQ